MKIEKLEISGGEILVYKITESIDELLCEIEHPDTLADFLNIKTDKRKLEFLAVRTALKQMLGKEVYVSYTDEGKPFLADGEFNISISHSKNRVAVGAHPDAQIGVDIECRSDKIPKLYKRFLNEEEQSYLADDVRKLQIAWSAKEALYKIIGKTAVDFARQLQILPFDATETSGKFSAKHLVNGKIYNLHYLQNEDFVLVWCCG